MALWSHSWITFWPEHIFILKKKKNLKIIDRGVYFRWWVIFYWKHTHIFCDKFYLLILSEQRRVCILIGIVLFDQYIIYCGSIIWWFVGDFFNHKLVSSLNVFLPFPFQSPLPLLLKSYWLLILNVFLWEVVFKSLKAWGKYLEQMINCITVVAATLAYPPDSASVPHIFSNLKTKP